MPGWIAVESSVPDEASRGSGGAGSPDLPPGDGPRTINIGAALVGGVVVVVTGVLLLTRELWLPLVTAPAEGSAVLATVNNDPITVRDIDVELAIQQGIQAQLGRQLQDDPDTVRAFRRDLLDKLVDQRLLAQASASAGNAVTDDELQAELPGLGQNFGIKTDDLLQYVLSTGAAEDEFAGWARRTLLVNEYVASDDARDKGLDILRERGLATEQGIFMAVKPEDVATYLQRQADIRFFDEGGVSSAANEGDPAPDFTLPDLDGQAVSLSDYAGRPVIVNFWATWCKPCEVEMPLFIQAYESYRDRGLVILAIDVQEQPDQVRPYVVEHGLTMPVILDRDGLVSTVYRVRGLPSTFFVGPDGTLVEAKRGAVTSHGELATLLEQILPTSTSQGFFSRRGGLAMK